MLRSPNHSNASGRRVFVMPMAAMAAVLAIVAQNAFGQITLTALTTGFNNPIGIDHHDLFNQVVMSVNFSNGLPHNFELVAADGTQCQFSSISGFTNEVKIATARDDGGGMSLGGFTAGELFTGSGVPGVIVRISPDGSGVQNPWVTLPGEGGLLRGSLHIDRTGVFGGDLIVVTTAGNVWRVNSSGNPTQLATIATHLEGLTTVPNDSAKYGPWAGKILAGAEQQILVYSIDTAGTVASFALDIPPEDIDIIPLNENFFGVDFGGSTLWGAPPSEFTSMVGDVLITQEIPGILWHVRWDAASNTFVATQIAKVTQWEHVTFSTAGIVPLPPICEPVEDPDVRTQGFWKRVCARAHPSGEHENLPDYVDCVNDTATFADVDDVDALCDRLHPSPPNDKCEQAEAQFMALLLNICSGRVAVCNCIDDPDFDTVGEAADFIDELLSNPDRTFDDCVLAQSIADDINNGVSLVDCP